MKNSKLRVGLAAVILLFTVSLITSCGDGTDVSDSDEKGKFSLTIDGTKYEGTEVFNGAAIGIRTLSAKNSSMEMGILLNETDYKAGATFDLSTNSMSFIKVGETASLPKSGTIKVVSISKIEILNGVFYDAQNDKDITVTGYISSK